MITPSPRVLEDANNFVTSVTELPSCVMTRAMSKVQVDKSESKSEVRKTHQWKIPFILSVSRNELITEQKSHS